MSSYLESLKKQRNGINKEIDRIEWVQSFKVDDEVAIEYKDALGCKYTIGNVIVIQNNDDSIFIKEKNKTNEKMFYLSTGKDVFGNELTFPSNEIKAIIEREETIDRLCILLKDKDNELTFEQVKDIDDLINKYLAGESFLKKYLSGELALSGMSSCGIGKIYI
jgi:hypothetical protein